MHCMHKTTKTTPAPSSNTLILDLQYIRIMSFTVEYYQERYCSTVYESGKIDYEDTHPPATDNYCKDQHIYMHVLALQKVLCTKDIQGLDVDHTVYTTV